MSPARRTATSRARTARTQALPDNRIVRAFSGGRRGLICYFPIGDPLLPASRADIYVDEGVDVFELGLPAARPYRDGATISDSMQRARDAGVTFGGAFARTLALRSRFPDQALLWMTYAGVIPASGLSELAAAADVDGVLYAERAARLPRIAASLAARNIAFPHFVPRGAPVQDMRAARHATGYVMLQSQPGVTGSTHLPPPDSSRTIERLRKLGVHVPIALGVGISEPDHVRAALAMGADAVILGSAVVEASLRGPRRLRSFLRSLREALDE